MIYLFDDEEASQQSVSSSVQQLKENFLDSIDNFILDCDGVLWSGTHLFSNIAETLQQLRRMGKRIFFLTNNSTKSREAYLSKFTKMGIEAHKEEVLSSSYAAAAYLKSTGLFDSKEKKVYVVGEAGITDELNEVGIVNFGGVDDANKTYSFETGFEIDPNVAAVVVGYDGNFNNYKLAYGHACVTNNKGCLFVATNTDSTYPAPGGRIVPGGGCFVAALATCIGREPIVCGKPSTFILDSLIKQHNLDRSRTVMVGDRLDTDILFGIKGGLKTMCVLTGVTTLDQIQKQQQQRQELQQGDVNGTTTNNSKANSSAIVPDYVIPSLSNLFY
eukprot:GEZU01010915.1.p1 GENE.GEZU01010915.1~~GEZU01010915.1.p1  ORF type:complete len:331 (+),score=100.08 GEZU01010915.1:117-1109(+)